MSRRGPTSRRRTTDREGGGATSRASRHIPLAPVRADPRHHWLWLVSGSVVGLVLASVHPLGLVVGGALVGLAAADLFRAVLSGIGFGVLAVLAWLGSLWWAGGLGRVLAMGELALLAVAIALGLSVLGSLARGVL